MVEAKTLCYGCRQQQQQDKTKQFGRNRGIPKTQRVLASTNKSLSHNYILSRGSVNILKRLGYYYYLKHHVIFWSVLMAPTTSWKSRLRQCELGQNKPVKELRHWWVLSPEQKRKKIYWYDNILFHQSQKMVLRLQTTTTFFKTDSKQSQWSQWRNDNMLFHQFQKMFMRLGTTTNFLSSD